MKRIVLAILGAFMALAAPAAAQTATSGDRSESTTDHSRLKPLMREFASGPEMTAACVSCHTEAADQVMRTLHCTWDFTNPATGQKLGKRNVLNSFCGNVATNETRCTSCHSGYGWDDMRVAAPADPTAVDCLACHIPEFARGGVATKTLWDWSTTCRLENGKPIALDGFTQSDGKELHTYLSTKGTFEWAENVVPDYNWFNGQMQYTTGLMSIDPKRTPADCRRVVPRPCQADADRLRQDQPDARGRGLSGSGRTGPYPRGIARPDPPVAADAAASATGRA